MGVLLEPDTMRGIKFLVEILCISLSLGLLFYQYRDQYLSADFTADSWEAEQFKRQARVQNVCSNHGLASPAKIPHQRGWLVASEQHFFMCRNHKVGTSTYIGTTFQQIADIRKFDRGLLRDMFLGTPKNMKGIQDKNSVSIAVICFILRKNRNNLAINSKIKEIQGINMDLNVASQVV